MTITQKAIQKMLCVFCCLCLTVSCMPLTALAAEGGEPAQVEGIYQIGTADELKWFAGQVNAGQGDLDAVLTADIVLNEKVLEDGALVSDTASLTPWTAIGSSAMHYTGTFDGAGHSVSGMYLNDNTVNHYGLVGYLGEGGAVKNVTVKDAYISGQNNVGAIVGYNNGGSVSGCSAAGVVSTKYGGLGGIVGYQNSGSVKDCSSSCTVSGGANVGGVVGYNATEVSGCTNSGDVTGTGGSVGGIVGRANNANSVITDCQNTGNVTAGNTTSNIYGGVVGISSGLVDNCTNSGTVTAGKESIGGIVGQVEGAAADKAIVSNCRNSGTVNGGTTGINVGGIVGRGDGSNSNKIVISGCTNEGSVSCMDSGGGVMGLGDYTAISDSSNSASVAVSANNSGGVAGYVDHVTLSRCWNTGSVTGKQYLSGVVGRDYSSSVIETCYNTASLSGTTYVGGIVGSLSGSANNCYSTGSVTGTANYVGALVGYSYGGTGKVSGYYIAGSANNGVEQYAVGHMTKTSSNKDSNGKTVEQFASGEVTYLLNGSTDQGDLVWKQTLGSAEAPRFEGEVVHYNADAVPPYYNGEPVIAHQHHYENGFCSGDDCDAPYEPAVLNDEDVYEISNGGQLYWFAEKVNAGETDLNAVLTANIVVNADVNGDAADLRAWNPIGYYKSYSNKLLYSGTFDGQGYTVSGLYLNTTSEYVGLIGYADNDAQILNVGVINSFFRAKGSVAGVVGYNNGGLVSGCWNSAVIESTSTARTAGVVGYNSNGTVTNCYNTGSVTAVGSYVGGVVGSNSGNVSGCYNTGSVTCTGSNNGVGGVVGHSNFSSETAPLPQITNCYNTGAVTGKDKVGGVLGYANKSVVSKCWNSGNVVNNGTLSIANSAGGVVGRCHDGCEVSNCYNLGAVTSSLSGAGGVVGTNSMTSVSSTVSNCYNLGSVTSTFSGGYVGGVVGKNDCTVTNCYYLTGCATDSADAVHNGIGNAAGSATADSSGVTTVKDDAAFVSGEVTYRLNGSASEGDLIWYQTIGEHNYPVFEGKTVYYDASYKPQYFNERPSYTTQEVSVGTGETVTITDSTGNYAENYDKNDLDETVATVAITGNTSVETALGNEVTSIVSGNKYIIVNDRANKPVATSAGSWATYTGLSLTGTAGDLAENTIWTIEAVEGGYTVKSAAGTYMTAVDGTYGAALSDSPAVLTITYTESGTWTLSSGAYYLNNAGGQGGCAFFWDGQGAYDAPTDIGSQWSIYEYIESSDVSTTITIEGVSAGETSVRVGNTVYEISVVHTCVFDKEIADDAFKASDATCTEAATYYYSCACGKNGDETFSHGDPLGHTYGNPAFSWNKEDYSAVLTVTCGVCDEDTEGHTQEVEATVTSVVTEGDCQNASFTTYTATAEYDGKTYTEDEVVPGQLGECADENNDHLCDVCGEELSDCADEDDDHLCDICGDKLSECADKDDDGKCDICGIDMETNPEETDPTEPSEPDETDPTEPSEPGETEPTECPKDETCVLSVFTDAELEAWYHDGAHYCVEEGLMNGTGNNKFEPNKAATRAMLVTILWREEGSPKVDGLENPFSDVFEGQWFYEPVVWAYHNGVVNGTSATTFSPDKSITREQIATILYRYSDSPETKGTLDDFADGDTVAEFAADAMKWAVETGLINGIPKGNDMLIAPRPMSETDVNGNATRAQVATILWRYLTK